MLNTITCSNLLDELIEPFLVLPRAEIGPSLLVAARILSCSASEFLLIEHLNLSGTSSSRFD